MVGTRWSLGSPGAQAFQSRHLSINMFPASCLMAINVDVLYKGIISNSMGVWVSIAWFSSYCFYGAVGDDSQCWAGFGARFPGDHPDLLERSPGRGVRPVSGCCFTFFIEEMRVSGPRKFQEGGILGRCSRFSSTELRGGGARKEMGIDRHFKKHYHLPWLLQQFRKNNNNHKIPDQSRGWIYEFGFHANSAANTKWVVKWNLKGSCSALGSGGDIRLPRSLPHPHPARKRSLRLMCVRCCKMELIIWGWKNEVVFTLIMKLLFVSEIPAPTGNLQILQNLTY